MTSKRISPRKSLAVACSLVLLAGVTIPVTPALADDSDSTGITKNLPNRDVASFDSPSGVKLQLGLGGPSFGSLYWLDYSGMTQAAWKAANSPAGTDITFNLPSGAVLSMHLTITGGVARKTVIDGQPALLPFSPMGTKDWGAFGAPAVDENGEELNDPYGFNYLMPAAAQPGLGYPELEQVSGLTEPYDVTVALTNISFTAPGAGPTDYRVIFADMEATDDVGVEHYSVSVDNFGQTPNTNGATLSRFGSLYSKYANRSQQENHWDQYGAQIRPCPSFADGSEATTISCEPVPHNSSQLTGPGGVMFSSRNTDQLAFSFAGRKPNAYGVGFLLPYQSGAVTVDHGNLTEADQSNFNLTLTTHDPNDQGDGPSVVTKKNKTTETLTRYQETVPGQPVTYTSTSTNSNGHYYEPSWSCQAGSLAPGGQDNGMLKKVDVKDLTVTTTTDDAGVTRSMAEVQPHADEAYVFCAVDWVAKIRPTVTNTVTVSTTVTSTGVPPAPEPSEPTTATTTPSEGGIDVTTTPANPGDGDTPGGGTPGGDTPGGDTPGGGTPGGDTPGSGSDGSGSGSSTPTTPSDAVVVNTTVTSTATQWVLPPTTVTTTTTATETTTTTATESTTITPSTVTETPKTVTVTPSTVTVTPSTVTETPKTVTVTPSTVTETPKTVTVTPSTVTETPKTETVTLTPSTVTETPQTVTETTTTTETETTTITPSTVTETPKTVTVTPSTVTETPETETETVTLTPSTVTETPSTVTETDTTTTTPAGGESTGSETTQPATSGNTPRTKGGSGHSQEEPTPPGTNTGSGSGLEILVPILVGAGVLLLGAPAISSAIPVAIPTPAPAVPPAPAPVDPVVHDPQAYHGVMLASTGADVSPLVIPALIALMIGAGFIVVPAVRRRRG